MKHTRSRAWGATIVGAMATALALGSLSAATTAAAAPGPALSSTTTTVVATSGPIKPITPKVHATYKLNPRVVQISAKDVRFETTKRDVAQQLTYVGTVAIGVGTIMVVNTIAGPFYGTVTAISGQTVTTKPATLGNIFEILNLTVSARAGSVSTNSSPVGGTPSALASRVAAGNTLPGRSVRPRLSATCSGTISPIVTLNATANAGTFTLQTSWNWAGGLKSASITDSPSFAITASAAVTGAGTCTLSQQLFNVDLAPIEFFIGYVPVLITQSISGEMDLDINASGSASIDLGYNAAALLGAAKPHGGSWGAVHTGSIAKTVNTSVNINATTTLHLPVSYEAALYGFGGLGVTVDPFAALAVSVSPPVCQPMPWFDLTAGLDGSIYSFVHFGSLYNWSHTFASVNFFTTDLINHQHVCAPVTDALEINTLSNVIQTTFVPGVAAGNVIPLHSTVVFKNVGTAYKYAVVVSNPDGSGTAFNVKPGHPQNYVLAHSGTYHIAIQGGVINNSGIGTINKHLTITVP